MRAFAAFLTSAAFIAACLKLNAATVQGQVSRLGSSEGISFAEVFAYAALSNGAEGPKAGDLLAEGEADAQGFYYLDLSASGEVLLKAGAVGYLPGRFEEFALGNDHNQKNLALVPLSFETGEVVVKAKRRPPQPSEEDLSGQESRRVPGSSGDVVRAVAALPGVAVANDYLANLMVRGGRFNDNLILLDGLPASYPFHFGGLESVFPSAALASVSLLPSGYDVRYGDRQGGVLELDSKAPNPGLHGEFSASFILLGGLLSEADANEEEAITGSYRRGFFDLVIPPHPELTAVPRYQDYLVEGRLQLWKDAELLLLSFGSQDYTGFYDPQSLNTFFWDSYFYTAGLRLIQHPWENWSLTSIASATFSKTQVSLADLNLNEQPYEWYLRQEAEYLLKETQEIQFGMEWHQTRTMLDAHFPRLPVELGSDFAFSSQPVVSVNSLGSKAVLSAWAQDRWHALSPLWISAGARYDYVDLTQEYFFSPRLAVEWAYDERTSWKANLGDYFQSLDPLETVPGWASNILRSEVARVWGISFEKKPLPGHAFKAEYYHKDFSQFIPTIIVDTSGNSFDSASDTRVALNSIPTGFADGVELSWRVEPTHGFFGWLSYAYNYSERSLGQGFYEADFNQPHTFQLVLNYTVNPFWELGFRAKAASGIPYTPILSRNYDASTGQWTPIFGPTNSAHLDWYQRLDFRTQYSFLFTGWTLRLYAEVINATNQPNVSSVTYKSDYSGIQLIQQLPRIYFAGLEAVF